LTFFKWSIAGNCAIVTYCKNFVRLAWYIDNTIKFDVFFVVVLFIVSFAGFFHHLRVLIQLIKINVAARAAGCKPKVIFKPVNTTDALDMACKLHCCGAI